MDFDYSVPSVLADGVRASASEIEKMGAGEKAIPAIRAKRDSQVYWYLIALVAGAVVAMALYYGRND